MITTNPAEDLVGVVLPSDWTVMELIVPSPGDTGGNFSVNYWVEDSQGRRGFCKVLNYYWLLTAGMLGTNALDSLAEASRIYQFERDLARECVGLSRVITALADGEFSRPDYLLPQVHYIIFEVADGDIRGVLDRASDMDTAAKLRIVHNLATGIRQLHGRDVAHQDVKPSNTLVFPPEDRAERVTKLGDLGRATVRARPANHDAYNIAGDPTYAPPEALYGAVPTDFGPRRLACDLYQLGSMLAFVFTSVSMNAYLKLELHPAHHWDNWRGTYPDVYPYVLDAYGRATERIARDLPDSIRESVRRLIQFLCHPDVLKRGHPVTLQRVGNPYALDRVVTEIDLLARRARLESTESA